MHASQEVDVPVWKHRGRPRQGKHLLRALPMKNGKWHTVLLAGGSAHTARDLREKIARKRDVYVKYHWEERRMRQWERPIPDDVDFCILLTDFVGHVYRDKLREHCKRQGIRMLCTKSKFATILSCMMNYGVYLSGGLPESVISTMYFDDEPDDVVEEPQLALVPPPPENAAREVIEAAQAINEIREACIDVAVSTPAPEPGQTVLTLESSLMRVVNDVNRPLAPVEKSHGDPSPGLAALAAALYGMCRREGVSLLITPQELTFTPFGK